MFVLITTRRVVWVDLQVRSENIYVHNTYEAINPQIIELYIFLQVCSMHLARPVRGEPPIGRDETPLLGANPPKPRTDVYTSI